ncbi:MAG: bacillithiol biosynthesis BshC, partial [Thermoplasmata archaeon]|nr:bacillithiol biosynthesis BshC [Thermoplasmata archaeon]NIY05039.1 bacillithiol biosynthesis BshC [Thermoplasmata archaeon]
VEPRHLRELMVPIFARMIEEPEATGRLVAQAGERLKQEGLKPPIDQPSWFCNFFLDRQRVAYEDGQFSIDGRAFSPEELLGLLQEEPQRFSADVVTRPIIQDWLFPTHAYVAGPHEASYLDQLREVYRWFSLKMPQILPRYGCTLVETRVRRIIDRYAPWIDDLEELRQPERLMKQIVKDTKEIGPTFARYRQEISRLLLEIK